MKMLHTRFRGLVLGLFFVLHALKNCSVQAYQGRETIGERHAASEKTVVSVQKEFLNGFGGRKMGGHEVAVVSKNSGANRSDGKCDFEENQVFSVKCKSWNETTTPTVETDDFVAFDADYHGPKVGKNSAEIVSIGKFQDQANNQVNGMNKLGPKTRDFVGFRIPRSGRAFHLPNSMQFEESKANDNMGSRSSTSDKPVSTEEYPAIGNTVELKRLLEAAKEIVNLMHKDYKGWDRPRQKPPINNHVPRH